MVRQTIWVNEIVRVGVLDGRLKSVTARAGFIVGAYGNDAEIDVVMRAPYGFCIVLPFALALRNHQSSM